MPIPVVFSWSAGKDSAFGLWTLLQDRRFAVTALLTTLTEGYNRVSMSGVREELLDRQVDAIGLPVIKVWIPPACANDIYERRMAVALATGELERIQHVAFGDLFLADIRSYREERLGRVGKRAVFPLWGKPTAALAQQMIGAGFRATVVCINPLNLAPSFAGRSYDADFLAELPDGVDPCGENGEFHSFVHDGPLFSVPVECRGGAVVAREGFVFADVVPA